MFDNLTNRLSGVIKTLRGQARLTESNVQDALREVRVALLEADVALPVVKEFIARVKERALGQDVVGSLTPGQAVVGVVFEELTALMGEANVPLDLATVPPAVILMAGLQGSGKTTTSGKLARLLREEMRKEGAAGELRRLPACGHRPAAHARGAAGRGFLSGRRRIRSRWPSPQAALDYARKHYYDVVIVDTAGRLAIDEAMMQEIRALHAALQPVETLFVVDAMQGQDAVNVAKAFGDALPLTGVVLTKLDGDARGGAALSVRHVTGKPIKFVGVGEKLANLEPFHPERMASRILGMGDVLSLVEEARRSVDLEEAEKLAKKVKSGKGFDLEDFKAQMLQMKQDGWPGRADGQAASAARRRWRRAPTWTRR